LESGFDGHDQVRNFGDQCPHRGLAHFRDQLLDSSKPGARVVRMDRADSAGMASVPGLQQRQHLADVNLADAGADRGNYARGRSRYAPRSGCRRPARPSDLSASLWDHRNDTRTPAKERYTFDLEQVFGPPYSKD
jgi:hypothetical protein